MSQINPISETFQGSSNSVYNLLYPGIIQGPFSSNVYVNSVLQVAVTDYNIIANTLIFYTGKSGANIVVQHYTDDNASINLTNLIELSVKTSPGTGANGFGVVNVAGQGDIIADTGNDTLTIIAGTGILLTTDAPNDTLTITATGGSAIDQIARDTANGAFLKSNSANVLAQAAFDKANTANITGEAAFSKANTANITGEAAFSKANDANTLAQSAFNKANGTVQTGFVTINIANSPNIVATGNANTLIFQAGEAIDITGNSSLNRINISATYLRNSDWVIRTPAANISWEQVTWADKLNLFVAISSNSSAVAGNTRVMTSPDGITWTSRVAAEQVIYTGITYNGNVLVAVASSTFANQVMISANAITWQSLPAAVPGIQWRDVTWNGNIFCAIAATGVANGVMISTDGTTWLTRVPAADLSWRSIVWAKELSLFVAVGTSGTGNRVMTSTDGTTWVSRTSAADNNWIDVTWNGKLFVAVAFSGTNNRVMTSPDGINWTLRYTPINNQWTAVQWTGTQFVVVSNTGTSDRIMTSPDGIIWTSRPSPQDCDWKGLAWNNKTLVAVGTAGNNNQVMTSTYDDILQAGAGITFTANSLANTLSLSVDASNVTTGTLAVARGGTGLSPTITSGALLIGNTTNSGFDLSTLANTGTGGILITNGAGTITLGANVIWMRGNLSAVTPITYTAANGGITHAGSGVTATGYANSNTIPVLVVNETGHLTSVVNTAIGNLDAAAITTGNLVIARGGTGRSLTGVTSGQLLIGNTTNSGFDLNTLANTGTGGILITNGAGTITLGANVIWIRGNVSNTTPILYDPATGIFSHKTSGVSATIYGGANTVPVVTVDTFGHITLAANSLINNLDASTITTGNLVIARGGTGRSLTGVTSGQLLIGNTTNSGFDLNTLANTGSGGILITNGAGTITLGANVIWMRGNVSNTAPINYDPATGIISHALSGVTATGYGDGNNIPVFVVTTSGHVSSVTNTTTVMSATIHQQTMSRISLGF